MKPIATSPYQKGFTLLEVMIALAIVALALTSLYVIIGRSIRSAYHAQMMSQATLLCRYKMGELEEQFLQNGFPSGGLTDEKAGTFFDGNEESSHPLSSDSDLKETYRPFRWKYTIEKINLPSFDQIIQNFSGGADPSSSSQPSGTGSAGTGASSNLLTNQIKDTIEQKVRKITMRVLWDEPDRKNQMVEVVAFYTDSGTIQPSLPGTSPPGTNGQTGSGSPPGTGSPGTGAKP